MQTTVNKPIALWKLGKELLAAGILHYGMSLFTDNVLEILLVDENQAAQALVVIAAHDGIDTIANRLDAAKVTAKNIPNWATWSQQDWQTYFNGNLSDTEVDNQVAQISTLTTAKTVIAIMWKRQNKILDALAKMEIALRDQVWPDLPE